MDAAQLAPILMGEAGTCGLLAMVAVAWVHQRNPRMNGWQMPNARAELAAVLWQYVDDPVADREFVFSRDDLRLEAVRRIIAERGPPVVFKCRVGELYFY